MEGKLLGDRYEILRRIGGGGMAVVYLARDRLLQRRVAVKVLHDSLGSDGEFVKRFDREAKAAASMSHPQVIHVFDVGREDNVQYMVMEYMEGDSLMDWIEERGALPAREAVAIAIQICEGLAHAHERGIVHRDIKPHNIMATADGRFKVGDFGISRLSGASAITQSGYVMGSVHYFSPEQARGRDVGPRSDLYSLGVVLFYMVTGTLPFNGDEAIAIALAHLQDAVPDPRNWAPDLPGGVCRVIARAMAKGQEDRYPSAAEMKADLQQAFEDVSRPITPPFAPGPGAAATDEGQPIPATSAPASGLVTGSFQRRKKRLWVGLLGAAVALILVSSLAVRWMDGGKPTEAEGHVAAGQEKPPPQDGDARKGDDPADQDPTQKPQTVNGEGGKNRTQEKSPQKPAAPPQTEPPEPADYDWRKDLPNGPSSNGSFRNFSVSGQNGNYHINVEVMAHPEQAVLYDIYVSDRYGSDADETRKAVPVEGNNESFVPVSFDVNTSVPDGEGMVKIRLYRADLQSGEEVEPIEFLLQKMEG